MDKNRRLSSRAKVIVGMTIIVLATLIMNIMAYRNMNTIEMTQIRILASMNAINQLTQLRSDENRVRALIMEIAVAEENARREEILESLKERMKFKSDRVDSIMEMLASNPVLSEKFRPLMGRISQLDEIRMKTVTMMGENKLKEAIWEATHENLKIYNEIRAELLAIEKQLDQQTKLASDMSIAGMERSLMTLFIAGLVIFIVSVIFVVRIMRLLSNISSKLKNGVNVLGTSTAEILTTVTEVSTGATETATAVSETTTTIEEIRQTSLLGTQRAQQVLDISNQASVNAEHGKESVNQTIHGMKKIREQMDLIAESVVRLSEQNRSIGEITGSVNDIADQSNLLAVNAAIEAAKAGEHGRGFAVVAQEIRNLSEQSKHATAQVKAILNDIQKGINQAVIATEQGAKAVEVGHQRAISSGETIDQLAENVDEAVQAVIQISNSSQQQMAGMDQIVPAMENIKQASDQNVNGIRQTQLAAQNLHEVGQNLKKIIEQYNL